ncbi:hypothetical protein [Hymenobacter sp. YC55]|uniref:hypothetical protein n=1 Tax=Hymenobacter sp. YC55 TaxID=3034019 RepID=UPI003211D05C
MFSETALLYLQHLAGEYTLGHVAELMSLSNANTIRFYWLLKSWEFRSPITVTVEKLRTITTGQAPTRSTRITATKCSSRVSTS